MIQELIDTFEELKKKKYFIDMGKGGLILIAFTFQKDVFQKKNNIDILKPMSINLKKSS